MIAQHRAAGRDVVLVSASGEEIVRPIASLLGIEHVIATRMAVADGRYTGEIEFYAAGEAKVEAVQQLAAEPGYDLARSYAYSDSISDLPLLSAVGHPPRSTDRALRRAALERGWEIRSSGTRCPDPPPGSRAVPVAAALGGGGDRRGLAWYGRRRRTRPGGALTGDS